MGLLKSVDDIPGVDLVDYRDELYYNKYEYRLRLRVPCARYTWYCKTPDDLDTKLAGKWNNYGNVRKSDLQTVTDNLPALKSIVEISIIKKKDKNFSLRLEGSTIAIFANDINKLQDFEQKIGSTYKIDYTLVKTSDYAGIKHFVNEPKHKYRVYFKSKRVEDNFHNDLIDTLEKQKKLYASPALKVWLNRDKKMYGSWTFRYLSSSYFIDYDDESTLSYLALMYGEFLGKKYKLEKRPDNI